MNSILCILMLIAEIIGVLSLYHLTKYFPQVFMQMLKILLCLSLIDENP